MHQKRLNAFRVIPLLAVPVGLLAQSGSDHMGSRDHGMMGGGMMMLFPMFIIALVKRIRGA